MLFIYFSSFPYVSVSLIIAHEHLHKIASNFVWVTYITVILYQQESCVHLS